MPSSCKQDAERVIRSCNRILVSAQSNDVSGSMSLYRAGLKFAFFLPLGVAMPSCDGEGFTDVSSVFTLPSRAKATQVDRTRVRKPSALSSTCVAHVFDLTGGYPTGRENRRRVRYFLAVRRRMHLTTIL